MKKINITKTETKVKYKSLLVDPDTHFLLKKMSLETGKPIIQLVSDFANGNK